MNGNHSPSGQSHTTGEAPGACTSRTCCPLQSRAGLLFWALLIGAIVVLQWPMLKGMYYRTAQNKAPESAVAWGTDFDAALAESARTGKPILADFTASWCPPCKVMQHEVWPDSEVGAVANDRYVPLMVDVDEARNAPVASRYDIRGIPSIAVIDSTGQMLRMGSFMSKQEMLDFLKLSTPGAQISRTDPVE